MNLKPVSLALRLFPFAILLFAMAGCGGGSIKSPVPAGPTAAAQHLYTNGANGGVLQFALPLTGSTPTATLSLFVGSDVTALAVDSAGNVAAGAFGGGISIFKGPITGSASASATFPNGTSIFVENLAFNSAGDLFATTESNSINVFTHPLTSASTPSQVITSANLTLSDGVAFDSANNLIVTNTPTPTSSNLLVYAPPYTGLPIATAGIPAASYRQMAISGTQLFVVNSQVSLSKIDVYNLPITAASAPAFLISTGLFGGSVSGDGVAVDSNGNLYAGLSGNLGTTDNGGVRIYVPPFSGASAPSATTGVVGTSLAVGK
jgi:sugar lactone lactonase YvrE